MEDGFHTMRLPSPGLEKYAFVGLTIVLPQASMVQYGIP